MIEKIKSLVKDYKLLLRSIPGLVTALFVLSVVAMNLMANKVIVNLPYVAADGGLLLSWIPFLCMDIICKRYGAKAATKLNIVALVTNLLFVGLFALVAGLQIEVGCEHVDYSAFDLTFSCTWFVLLGSSIAFLFSGIINNVVNEGIGKLCGNKNNKVTYCLRSYVSTFVGQFADNLLFSSIVYIIFAPIYWGFSLQFIQCVGSAVIGALLELLMEVIFSPIGYKVSQQWEKDRVGAEYLKAIGEE